MGRMRGMRYGVFAALAVALGVAGGQGRPAAAQTGPAAPAGSDLRVYVVVLDGLMAGEVRPEIMPNLSALRAQGTWYEQARAVLPAETLPNHAAMMTGVLPARNGIVGNDYWQPNDGGASKSRMAHPKLLGADTLVSRLEERCPATSASSVTTANFMGKGYLGDLFAGEAGDFYPTNWSDFGANPDHPGLQRPADYNWKPGGRVGYIPDPDDHTLDQMVMKSPPSRNLFQPSKESWDRGGFLTWLAEDPPGPRFAFVSLGDIDRAGHVDTTGLSVELGGVSAFRQAALAQTDGLLGELVAQLKRDGAWEKTVLIFASDHGMDWSPPDNGSSELLTPVRSVAVTTVLYNAGYRSDNRGKPGKSDPAGQGDFQVVPGGGTAAVYAEEAEDVADMARRLGAHPGVELVATRAPVAGLANSVTLRELGMENRVNGDLVVFVKDGWAVRDGSSLNPLPGNHGHAATQQTVLLVAGGHPALDATPQSVAGEPVYDPAAGTTFVAPAGGPGSLSVAPTVAGLFGLGQPPGGYDGTPLTEAFDPGALAAQAPCGAPAAP